MKSIYLSIDLDYWQHDKFPHKLINRLLATKVPIIATEEHHLILDHVNKHRSTDLVSIDYHSDLAEEPCKILDCGTWANFVKWQKKATFYWVHPHAEGELESGYCHGTLTKNPFIGKFTNWRQAIKIRGPLEVEMERVVAGAIVLSPDYGTEKFLSQWTKLVARPEIEYQPAPNPPQLYGL